MPDASPTTKPDKSPKTKAELEALVLAELRAASDCGGAVHVTVVAFDDYRVPATWEVASCNPGTSAPEACERALCESSAACSSISISRGEARRDHMPACESNEPDLPLFDCPTFGRNLSTIDVSDSDDEKATT
jgi:hypothetical protein